MYLGLCRAPSKDTGVVTEALWVSALALHWDPSVRSMANLRLNLDIFPPGSCRHRPHSASSLCHVLFALEINSWHLWCSLFTGELNTKIVMGTVTSFGNDYGWIEDCIFFSTDAIIGSIPLRTGDKVLAFVEEDPLSHELKATEVSFA